MDTFKLYLAGKIVDVSEGKMKDLAMKIDRVASNMRKDRMMKPFVDKFKKDAMKTLDVRKSLEKVLPDYVAGKTLDKVMKEAVNEMHCRDCNCEYGNIDPNCDCPNDGSNPEGKHWVSGTNEAMNFNRMKLINKIAKQGSPKVKSALKAPSRVDNKDKKKNEGLWDNIRKKKARIAKGSGEKMRSKGDKGAPTPDQIKRASEGLEEAFKVKDTVIPKVGPHKGVKHEIIHDFKDGTYNIKPIGLSSRQIKYRMGAAKAKKADLKSVKEAVEVNERNYRKEYDNYQGRPEQIANRSSRNSARRIMGDKAVKGMDVGHKDNNPLNNDPKNLQMEDPSENRREPRTREVEEKATDKRMRNWHKDYDFDQDRDIIKGFVSPKAKSMAKKMVKDVVPMVKATKMIRSKFPGMKMGAISDLLKKEGLPQALKAKDSARRKEYNAFQKARRK